MAYQAPKTNWAATDGVTVSDLNRIEGDVGYLHDTATYQTATGTATAIVLSLPTLADGVPINFVAANTGTGAATTINGTPVYKPNTTVAPTFTAGKPYTVYYHAATPCFFIKASAEGDVVAADVLAGKKFSNDSDTGIVGTMIDRTKTGDDATSGGQPINKSIHAFYDLYGATPKPRLMLDPPTGYYGGSYNGYAYAEAADVAAAIGLTAPKLLAGQSACNVNGSATSDATANAAGILNGETAYVNGAKVTGNIPVHGSGSDPSCTSITEYLERLYLKPPMGYFDGNSWVTASNSDVASALGLTADKLVEGNTVCNVAGTAKKKQDFSAYLTHVPAGYIPIAFCSDGMWCKYGANACCINSAGTTINTVTLSGYSPLHVHNGYILWYNVGYFVAITTTSGTVYKKDLQPGTSYVQVGAINRDADRFYCMVGGGAVYVYNSNYALIGSCSMYSTSAPQFAIPVNGGCLFGDYNSSSDSQHILYVSDAVIVKSLDAGSRGTAFQLLANAFI